MTTDPLDAFFDAPEKIEGEMREKLAKMLVPFAAADPSQGTIHLRTSWGDLNTKQRVLVVLLGRLALATKDPSFNTAISAKEIETITGMPGGTIRPKLSELLKDHIAFRDSESNYGVRSTSISLNNAWAVMEDALAETDD